MARADLATIVSDAWERAMELASYGSEPLTVGWWRGEAHVYRWDWRTGAMGWFPFGTSRQPPSEKPRAWDPFRSSAAARLLAAL